MRCSASLLPAVLLCAFPAILSAQTTIPPGFDTYQVDPTQSVLDFSAHPIPAGAFGPGSDPFSGIVPVYGVPLDFHPECPGDDLTEAHALFERTEELVFPADPSSDTVPVRMRALGLRNIHPVTVTFHGSKRAQQFNMYWCALPPEEPDPWTFHKGPGPAPWPLTPDIPPFPAEAGSVRVSLSPILPTPDSPAVPAPLSPDEEPVPWTWARPTLGEKTGPCGHDLCVNGDAARLLDLGTIRVFLKGACPEPVVGSRGSSWGRLKAVFD